jgi:hypothetical protein
MPNKYKVVALFYYDEAGCLADYDEDTMYSGESLFKAGLAIVRAKLQGSCLVTFTLRFLTKE